MRLSWMGVVRAREIERLRSLNDRERSEPFVHWKYTRTARKVMRRMLEHLVEVQERLGVAGLGIQGSRIRDRDVP